MNDYIEALKEIKDVASVAKEHLTKLLDCKSKHYEVLKEYPEVHRKIDENIFDANLYTICVISEASGAIFVAEKLERKKNERKNVITD